MTARKPKPKRRGKDFKRTEPDANHYTLKGAWGRATIYEADHGLDNWHWQLKAKNGRTIGDGSGFNSYAIARRAFRTAIGVAARALAEMGKR